MGELDNKKSGEFSTINSLLFGHNIKKLRNDMKLTREEFSELSGVSVDYLGKIERGQDIPSLAICVKISETLNTTIDYLLNESADTDTSIEYGVKLNKLVSRMSENDKKFLVKFLELHKLYLSNNNFYDEK